MVSASVISIWPCVRRITASPAKAAPEKVMVSAPAVALASAIASRRDIKPLSEVSSSVVVTVKVAIAGRSPLRARAMARPD